MPRKTKKPRKPAGQRPVTAPRPSRRKVSPGQTVPRDDLARHRRPDKRPPIFPGRLGGR